MHSLMGQLGCAEVCHSDLRLVGADVELVDALEEEDELLADARQQQQHEGDAYQGVDNHQHLAFHRVRCQVAETCVQSVPVQC